MEENKYYSLREGVKTFFFLLPIQKNMLIILKKYFWDSWDKTRDRGSKKWDRLGTEQ